MAKIRWAVAFGVTRPGEAPPSVEVQGQTYIEIPHTLLNIKRKVVYQAPENQNLSVPGPFTYTLSWLEFLNGLDHEIGSHLLARLEERVKDAINEQAAERAASVMKWHAEREQREVQKKFEKQRADEAKWREEFKDNPTTLRAKLLELD